MQVRLPQQTGVKALYWRRQMVAQQQLLQQSWHHADACPETAARAATLEITSALSFFMAIMFFCEDRGRRVPYRPPNGGRTPQFLVKPYPRFRGRVGCVVAFFRVSM